MPPKNKANKAQNASVVSTSTPTGNRHLPPKDALLFKQVLQDYEQKKWEAGIKSADILLKNHPEHGETLAMKGLFLHSKGPDFKDEAYALVKRGVKNDSESHIVWHVYGLLNRADKKFEEALTCYKQAQKIERDSMNILGDLASLTIQLRKLDEYVNVRHDILRVQPRLRRNWISLAVAQHLAGQFKEAEKTLQYYKKMLREVPENEYEYSEVMLYFALVLEESGQLEKALNFLEENSSSITDKLGYSVQRARILLKLGKSEAAEWAWAGLLEENANDHSFIRGYLSSKGVIDGDSSETNQILALTILDEMVKKHPKSIAIPRFTLDYTQGPEFEHRASDYLIKLLSKGVPSLFPDIKALYLDLSKAAIIEKIATGFLDSLEKNSNFGANDSVDEVVESTASFLWTLFFLAQHYSATSNQEKALEIINRAIGHTPSLPDLYMLKARILKRAGDFSSAALAMGEARELDGQDRFLNSKHAKYLIRAGDIKGGESILSMFTKNDAPSALEDLTEMQCLWFVKEEGNAYLEKEQLNLALKRFNQIRIIFNDVEEDQYDFHTYSIRKMTVRAYIDMIRYMDTLRNNPEYIAAATGAIQIYTRLHDNPSLVPAELADGKAEAQENERRMEAQQKRKAEQEKKAQEKKKGKKPAANNKEEEEEQLISPVDYDPEGNTLLATSTPLENALKFLRPLEKAAPQNLQTWLLCFEVSIRAKKYIEALRALVIAKSLKPSAPQLIPLIIRLKLAVDGLELDSLVQDTIQRGLKDLLDGHESLKNFNDTLLQKPSAEVSDLLAAAEGYYALDLVSEAEELLFSLLKPASPTPLSAVITSRNLLKNNASERVEEFQKLASKKFPLSRIFSHKE